MTNCEQAEYNITHFVNNCCQADIMEKFCGSKLANLTGMPQQSNGLGQPPNQVRGGKPGVTHVQRCIGSGLTVQVHSTAGGQVGREALSHQTGNDTGQNVTGASGSQPGISEG